MSISNELKKLACCFTGEELVNIDGESISEVLGYMTDNLNVEPVTGKLRVTEYKEPAVPSVGGNLLYAPISLTCDGSGAPAFQNIDYSIGIEDGKQYKVEATVDGENLWVLCNSVAVQTGMIGLVGVDTEMPYIGGTTLILYDGCYVVDGEPIYDSTYSTIAVESDDEQPHAVVINSITEVEEVNLLSEPITIAEIWNGTSGPVEISSIGLEIGKNYKVTGYYGTAKTPFEYSTTTIAGADDIMPIPEGGSFTRLVNVDSRESGNDENIYYFSIDCIDCSDFTGDGLVYNAEKALLACGCSGSDSNRDMYRDIVIESITEA